MNHHIVSRTHDLTRLLLRPKLPPSEEQGQLEPRARITPVVEAGPSNRALGPVPDGYGNDSAVDDGLGGGEVSYPSLPLLAHVCFSGQVRLIALTLPATCLSGV